MGVGIRPDPQRQALVHRAAGQPVKLGPASLHDRDPGVGGQFDRLADPLVRVQPRPDMQRDRRHCRPQRFEHRVAACDDLSRSACSPVRGGDTAPAPDSGFRGRP